MKKETDPIRKQLDGLLAEIGAKKNAIAFMTGAMEAAIARAAAEFEPEIKRAQDDLNGIEAELVGLAKYNKATLFSDTDRVDLRNGALLRQIQRRVVKIKSMLANLKAAGMLALIKVSESPDWDSIERLPEEELKRLGARRQAKESFAYELRRS